MKKTLTIIMVFGLMFAQAQVGINTDTPKATLDVKKNSNLEKTIPQGLILPKLTIAERSAFTNVEDGMTIYNLDKKCIEIYTVQSGVAQWNCMPNTASAQGITVSPAGFEGTYLPGETFTDANKVKFELKNNSFSKISNMDFSDALYIRDASTNVTVSPGQNNSISLEAGASTVLSYSLSGTPREGITILIEFNKLGLQADQSVNPVSGSATIANTIAYVVSLTTGSTTIQGKINSGTEKLEIEIPYTQGEGSYNAFTNIQTVGEGVDEKNLTLNIPAGNFGANGKLTATITADIEYLVKLQAPGVSYDIVTFPITLGTSVFNVEIKGSGGIPDRNFGNGTHNFVYLPVEVTGVHNVNGQPYKKTWLNMNLGATYAKADGSSNFNPAIALYGTDAHTDAKTYGSLFQWQRKADGHEFRGSPATTELATSWTDSDLKWDGKFISTASTNWVSTGSSDASGANAQLWQTGGANNPCPIGYHVPTETELLDLHQAITGTRTYQASSAYLDQTILPNFSLASYRKSEDPAVPRWAAAGTYWSSTASDPSNRAYYMSFMTGKIGPATAHKRTFGFSVRCIKD